MDFFKIYPGAKPLWKVGGRFFLNHAKDAAYLYAAQNGMKVEKYTGKANVKKKTDKNK